jgi:glycosyltransferase involved in cell wall biosynthesis
MAKSRGTPRLHCPRCGEFANLAFHSCPVGENGRVPVRGHASIGFALIARNAEETLPRCLDSIRPHVEQIVVGVDETTTDRTAKVAKKHGADVVFPVKVSDWHECPRHGRILAQHFADARNESFKRLDWSLDCVGWIDSDDVLERADRLPDVVKGIPDGCPGVWCDYHYSTVQLESGQRQTNTLFARERILKTRAHGQPIAWVWRYRVHEVVQPTCAAPLAGWIIPDERSKPFFPQVVHQGGQHKSESSAARNLTLLEIDYERDPSDSRTIFYLGNQFFALQEYAAAAHWYERLLEQPANPYEQWQAMVYCAKAYQILGDVPSSMRAAYAAMEVEPRHPEPYYCLAQAYAMTGDWAKVLYWTQEGRTKVEPPFFVFKNPLDYSYVHHLPMADALDRLGRVSDALRELEQAYAVLPEPAVAEGIARHKATLAAMSQANAFVALCRGKSDDEVLRLWDAMGFDESVRRFGRVRDIVAPALIRRRDREWAA